jgi:hypothetical protein
MSKWCSNFATLWLMVGEERKEKKYHQLPLETKSNPFVICKADLKQVMKHYWTWGSCFAVFYGVIELKCQIWRPGWTKPDQRTIIHFKASYDSLVDELSLGQTQTKLTSGMK